MSSAPNILQAGQLSTLWSAFVANDNSSSVISIPVHGQDKAAEDQQFLTVEDIGILCVN